MSFNGTISRKNLMILEQASMLLELLYERDSVTDEGLPLDLAVALLDGASNLENVIAHYREKQ